MAYIPELASVVAFQSDPTKFLTHSSVSGVVNVGNQVGSVNAWLQSSNASVITVGSPVANQSVSGTVGSSVLGHAPVVIVGGSILTSATPNQSVSGTVQAQLLSTDASIITVGGAGVANQSVSGTVGASIIGLTPVSISNVNLNVGGSVVTFQAGTQITSLVSTIPSSVIVGASIFGALPPVTIAGGIQSVALAGANTVSVVGQVGASLVGTAPVTQAGTWSTSVMTNVITSIATAGQVMGSVATLQGTNPWIVNFQNSSIIAINAGSVITINPGSIITVFQAPSIVGTYAEDSAHTTADKGFFVMGVRNDTVASFAGSNGEYNPFAHDSAGRVLSKPFAPEQAMVEGYNSVVSTSVTTLVAAAGAGLRNYITDIIVANTGATTTLLTFRSGGGASVLGYTIAPAGGGSNVIGMNFPLRTLANQTFDFQPTSASSIIYVTVKGFKAP